MMIKYLYWNNKFDDLGYTNAELQLSQFNFPHQVCFVDADISLLFNFLNFIKLTSVLFSSLKNSFLIINRILLLDYVQISFPSRNKFLFDTIEIKDTRLLHERDVDFSSIAFHVQNCFKGLFERVCLRNRGGAHALLVEKAACDQQRSTVLNGNG